MNIFDIIGPIMIGPSSSHTAGAVRIGNLAMAIYADVPDTVTIKLYNSFSKTGPGHGTDKALIAGLLGYLPDDERIINAFSIAKEAKLNYQFIFSGEMPTYHPNTTEIIFEKNGKQMSITGNSLGGGRVSIIKIDGYDLKFSGEYHTIMIYHEDVPGVVATVTNGLFNIPLNIDFISLFKSTIPNEKLMMIETKQAIPKDILALLEGYSFIKKASVISKV